MDKEYIKWLEEQSMLYNAGELSKLISANKLQWKNKYGNPQPESVVDISSVWFTSYPPATIKESDKSILQALADEDLWKTFKEVGIQGIHTGPMKRSGGIRGKEYTPTVDGWFDRITLTIDPAFGNDDQYKELCKTAEKFGGIIAGDIIPSHTGKGADFLLATMNYKNYPGLYHMVEIEESDWHLLPDIPDGEDMVNLSYDTVNILKEKGYIVGHLQRLLFSVPGVDNVTSWEATDKIEGVDGKVRRWVYLHYFKPGQPSLNWLDPTFAAARIIAGDIIKTKHIFGATVLRLDANPFTGIEIKEGSEKCWSEGHPLSVTGTHYVAYLVRKLGGYSFQELNLTLDAIKSFSEFGPELSYDFITRPAYQHALLTGNAGLLKLSFKLMDDYGIKPVSLIHALQNHDEFTYELNHFIDHGNEYFEFNGEKIKGSVLRDRIRNEMNELAMGEATPYNRLSGNGLCTTNVGLCASALRITDIYNLTDEQAEKIKKAHLLMAAFNAMQPGIFALSGWDLVGALPVKIDLMQDFVADGDYRWINRGSFDLLNKMPKAEKSDFNIPKAETLYGPINEQLKDPNSFLSQVKNILAVRDKYKIQKAKTLSVPEVRNNSVIAIIHELPDKTIQMTILNFADKNVTEKVQIKNAANKQIIDIMDNENIIGTVSDNSYFNLELTAYEFKVLIFK